MGFAEKRIQARQRRSYTASDGTVFRLKPVNQMELVIQSAGHSPQLLAQVLPNGEQPDSEEQRQKLAELLDQKGGPELLLTLNRLDDMVLACGIIEPPILPDNTPEEEVDRVQGMWVSDFKALYPDDWPRILEAIRNLSNAVRLEGDPARFRTVPSDDAPSGENVRENAV